MDAAYALFDTALGRCAIAWRGAAVAAFALPGEDAAATAAQVTRRLPGAAAAAPPPAIQSAIAAVQRLAAGAREDLRAVPVDLSGASEFERSIYQLLRDVGPGETVTYGELAARAGRPGAARAVGMAMGRNPVPVIIPCHRVLASGGRSGGFSAPGGVATKFALLRIEQAGRSDAPLLFESLPLAVRG